MELGEAMRRSRTPVLMVDPIEQRVIVHQRNDLRDLCWYRTEQESGMVSTHLGEIPFSAIYANLELLPTTATP